MIHYQAHGVTLHHGDALAVLATLPDNSVDAVVTDPPYGLEFMGKEWDSFRVDDPGTNRHRGERAGGHGEVAATNTTNPAAGVVTYGGGKRPSTNRCTGCGKRDQFRNAHDCDPAARWVKVSLDPYAAPPSMLAFQEWVRRWAAECLRVLKPGGHLLAFGGTRTAHRLTAGIEDAGFEIRDSIAWLYGSGFPKSSRVGRDARYCHCDATVHTSSDTSPALPLADRTRTADAAELAEGAARNAPRATNAPPDSRGDCRPGHDSGDALPRRGATIDPTSPQRRGCAPERSHSAVLADGQGGAPSHTPSLAPHTGRPSSLDYDHPSHSPSGEPQHTLANTSLADTSESAHRTPDTHLDPSSSYGTGFPVCTRCGRLNVDGLGTALKPAHEPVTVARKPLQGSVAANVLAWGTGAINIDAGRIEGDGAGTACNNRDARGVCVGHANAGRSTVSATVHGAETSPSGRWPANVALDESAAAELDTQSGELHSGLLRAGITVKGQRNIYGADAAGGYVRTADTYADSGGASRFLYVAKADADERPRVNGTSHPTVKPLALMRWLVRMFSPPGGTVLDPFAGSGTTAEACLLEGMRCVTIEREADYLPFVVARVTRQRDPVAHVALVGDPHPTLFDTEGDAPA